MVEKARNLAWTKFGRYALLEKIGSGGMAEIYRAKTFGAAGFEKEFAIKLILPSLVDDKEFVDMFINEAKIAVSLYHANVVQVFDLGELDGQYYIAMEFVHGKDLLDVLARCAEMDLKIPLDIVLFVTMEMLKGLDFAHRAKDAYGEELNIIHRDVSPSNVLISYAGDCKIGDFGVAKAAIQRNMTESGTLKGKVGYMSPEQVIGEDIDARSDIFSAGIVFFEALSMSRLFTGNSDLDVMLKVRDADIDSSLSRAQPLPDQLESIVRRALSKHRQERFQTAGEFYQALVDFCFQHRIKVTGTDLSNFMRRLFAEEIEAEKNQRRHDQEAAALQQQVRTPEAAPSSQARLATAPPADSETHAPGHDTDRPAAEPGGLNVDGDTDDASQSEGFTDARRPSRYRYRDASGLIYGPMGQKTLVNLVRDREPEKGDKVSIDGQEWVDPNDVDILLPIIRNNAGTTRRADAAQSVPVGAAVYRPGRSRSTAEVGDESTVREDTHHQPALSGVDRARAVEAAASALEEISLAGATRRHDKAATSGSSLDSASSSPVLQEVPSATGPETAEEARKVIRKLRAQYASYEGSFEAVTFARLFARLHRSRETGRLHVQSDNVEKSIYFEEGEPILVDSNKQEELLGSFLLARGVISESQLEEGLARLSEWGGRLGDALVATGAIPAHEIFKHLSDQMREKLLDIFTWKSGVYGYFENQQPDMHGYPLGLDAWATIVEGCLERMPVNRIRRFYDGRKNLPMHRRHNPPVSVDDLRMTTKALRVYKHYEHGDSLARLLRKLPDEQGDYIYRVIYLLHQVEIFTFEQTKEQDLPGPAPQP